MALTQSGKILRIGILQGGRIIEERYFRKRQSITIGDSTKAIFVLPMQNAPIPKVFSVFSVDKNQYELCFNEKMSGKVTLDGKVVELEELKKSPKVVKQGDLFKLPMNDTMRGTVKVGEATVLFQFVLAPPLPARPKLPASVRGGWIKSIDWAFVGVFLGSFILHAGFLGYSSTMPIPKKATLETVEERFVKYIAADLPKFKKEEEAKAAGDEKTEEPVKVEENKRDSGKAKGERKQLSEAEQAEANARRQAEIAKKVAGAGLVHLLTAKGPAEGGNLGAFADTLSEGGRFASIDDTMSGVSGVGVAQKTTDRGRRGGGAGGEGAPDSKEIGRIGVEEGGGQVELKGREEKQVKAAATLGRVDVEGSLDSKAINNVVSRYFPAVKMCYEAELRRNPSLAGKVVIGVTVGATGSVVGAEVVSSSLRNSTVESCLVSTVKRWRFPRPDEGDQVYFDLPFTFMKTE